MHSWGETSLGEEHGAELAAPDQADPYRLAGGGALRKHTVEIHDLPWKWFVLAPPPPERRPACFGTR
jgi:hypothetical protein